MASKDENNIIVEIELDDKKLSQGFKDTKNTASKSGQKAGKDFSDNATRSAKRGLGSLSTFVTGLAGAFAAAFAVREVTEAAKIQENAINEINTALKLSGQFTRAASEDFQNFASTLQENSIVGDEVILSNAALIQNLGKLEVDALKPATQAALDMAAALNIDLRSASTLVGKAAAGEISSFSRYGVVIQKGATQAETFANTLKALEGQFGGAARAKLSTYGGAISQLSNIWGDLKEEVGFFITQSPVVIAAFKVISERILGISKSLKGIRGSKDTFNEITTVVVGFGRSIIDNVVRPFEFLYNASSFVISALKTGLQSLVAGVAQYWGALADLANRFGVDNGLTQGIQNFRDSTAETFNEMVTDTQNSMSKVFDFSVSESSTTLVNEIAQVADSIKDTVKRIPADTGKAVDATVKKVDAGTKKISGMIENGLARSIAGGIQVFTQSLIDGQNGFENFTKFIISTMGDLAIQLGTFFIAEGIAGLAMKSLDFTGTIAAGAGLIALGTLMKSIGGESSSVTSSSNVSAQTGGEAFGNDTSQNVSNAQPEIEERQTSDEYHFHGEILGDERSAERIVDYIKIAKNNGAFA